MNCKVCDCALLTGGREEALGICGLCEAHQEDAARCSSGQTVPSTVQTTSDATAVPSGAVSGDVSDEGRVVVAAPKRERKKNLIRDNWIDRAYKAEFKVKALELRVEDLMAKKSQALHRIDCLERRTKTHLVLDFCMLVLFIAMGCYFLCR